MNVKSGFNSILLAATLAAMLIAPAESWAQKGKKPGGGGGGGAAYSIIPFMPAGSTSTSSAIADINDQGQAIGHLSFADGHFEAIHLDIATETYTPFPTGVYVSGINNLGQMVGEAEDNPGSIGYYWDYLGAVPVLLPPLNVNDSTYGLGINDDGVIYGQSGVKPVIWRVQNNVVVDGPVELPPLYAGDDPVPQDINETIGGTAQIVGDSGDAVVWTIDYSAGAFIAPDPPVAVGTLGGSWSEGRGINNFGDVCGDYEGDGGNSAAFVALADQDPQPLPVPRATNRGWAENINDQGEIVGRLRIRWRGFPTGKEYAYLWKDGEAIDLNKQIPSRSGWDNLYRARMINNAGIIGGLGGFNGQQRGFILIPNTE